MFVLINLDKLTLVAKSEGYTNLCLLAEIECVGDWTIIFPLDDSTYLRKLTTLELINLYDNVCGHRFNECERNKCRVNLFSALLEAPVTKLNHAELVAQVEKVKEGNKYVYVYGSKTPQLANETTLFTSTYFEREVCEKLTVQPCKRVSNKVDTPVKEKENNSTTGSTLTTRPRKSGACALVWEMCDELLKNLGRIPTGKEVKAEALNREINPSTASVQFNKWKNNL